VIFATHYGQSFISDYFQTCYLNGTPVNISYQEKLKHENSSQKIAIIIPHRHRESHLRLIVPRLNKLMKKGTKNYRIFVVHQQTENLFNKAVLINAGVKQAQKLGYDCFIIHDVDMLPDTNNDYHCNYDNIRHIGALVDKYNHKMHYQGLVGGVLAFTYDQFRSVNGYSNSYAGWGGEDDDMFIRIVHSCHSLSHDIYEEAKFSMIVHDSDSGNVKNPDVYLQLMNAGKNMRIDGLSSVDTFYGLESIQNSSTTITELVDSGSHFYSQNSYTNVSVSVYDKRKYSFDKRYKFPMSILVLAILTTICVIFRFSQNNKLSY